MILQENTPRSTSVEDQRTAEQLKAYAQAGGSMLGIYGGMQMLGTTLIDPEGLEEGTGELQWLGNTAHPHHIQPCKNHPTTRHRGDLAPTLPLEGIRTASRLHGVNRQRLH